MKGFIFGLAGATGATLTGVLTGDQLLVNIGCLLFGFLIGAAWAAMYILIRKEGG